MVEGAHKVSLVFVVYLVFEVLLASEEYLEYLVFREYSVHFCFRREEIPGGEGVGAGHVFFVVPWTSLSTCGQGC